jgi:hypothetical protein
MQRFVAGFENGLFGRVLGPATPLKLLKLASCSEWARLVSFLGPFGWWFSKSRMSFLLKFGCNKSLQFLACICRALHALQAEAEGLRAVPVLSFHRRSITSLTNDHSPPGLADHWSPRTHAFIRIRFPQHLQLDSAKLVFLNHAFHPPSILDSWSIFRQGYRLEYVQASGSVCRP